jgi:hypothetical protein
VIEMPPGEVQKFRVREEEYDQLVSAWTRKVKENSFLNLSTSGGTIPGVAGDFVLASETLDDQHEALIDEVEFGADGQADFCIVIGTSTILNRYLNAAGSTGPIQSAHFLARVPPSTTVSIVAIGASTVPSYRGHLSAVIRPIAAALEP